MRLTSRLSIALVFTVLTVLTVLTVMAPPADAAEAEDGLAPGAAALPTALRISMPFPNGVEFKVSCDYSPCTFSHARTDEPDAINDFYALDLIRNESGNGRDKAITAAAPGEVISAGWAREDRAIYGRVVVLKHELDGESFLTAYAHLAQILVEEGQLLKAKEQVGLMGGSSWYVDDRLAPHVHFAVYRGAEVVDGVPIGGQSVKPEPIDGYTGLAKEQVLVAGDGARPAVFVTVDEVSDDFELERVDISGIGGEVEIYESIPNPWVQWSYGHPEAWTDTSGYGGWTRVIAAPARPLGSPRFVGWWRPALPEAGTWRIQVFAPISDGASASAARYRISSDAEEVSCALDQTAGTGDWVDLCAGRTFSLAEGRSVEVALSDATGDGPDRRVGWDAVRFVKVGD